MMEIIERVMLSLTTVSVKISSINEVFFFFNFASHVQMASNPLPCIKYVYMYVCFIFSLIGEEMANGSELRNCPISVINLLVKDFQLYI